jgi:DNA polymerase III epsilon subunit-like protein
MPDICRHYGVVNRDAHRASGDVEALAECFPRLLTTLQHRHNVHTWGQLQRFMGEGPTAPETAPTVPVSIPAVEAVSNSLVSHVQIQSWKRGHLENLRRAELQTLAKAHGIKANQTSAQIIAELIALQARKQVSNTPSLLGMLTYADVC